MAALLLFLLSSRFSLDHPGTRPLSAGPSLGPEHPGTRLATPRCACLQSLVIGLDLVAIKYYDQRRQLPILPSVFFQHAVHQLAIEALFKLQVFLISGTIVPSDHCNSLDHWTIVPSDHWRIILTDLCCRPSSRNGKYTNGVAGGGGGYPGIQNMAYSPAYSNGVSYLQHSGIAFTFLGDKHFHKFTCVKHLHF